MFVGQSYLLNFTVLNLHLHQTTNICLTGIVIRIINHLIGKVKMKFQQDFPSRDTAQTLVELCAIRDGLSTCNALSYSYACELINLISLD